MAAEASTGRFRPAAAAAPPASASARVALAAAGLTVVMFGACGVLLLLTRDYQRAAFGAGGTVAALVCLVVGFVVARRQPASPIGWLLLGWSLLTPLVGVALLYAVLDYRVHHGALPFGPVAVMAESGEFGIAVLAALTVLLFPDGRSQPLRSPGGTTPPDPPAWAWRWLLWIFLAASAMFTATLVAGQALAIERHPLSIGPSGAPLAVPAAGGILGPLGWTADALILVCWAIIMARQVSRYRRSAGNQRQQLKWLIGGAACCVVATTITIFAGNYSSQAAQAVQDAADLGAAMLPAAIGVGIVKYRLYDIDRIFSRTLAYAIVTGLLVGVYLGLVLLASLVRPSILAGRRGGLDAGGRGAVPPATPPGAAGGGPAVQPGPVQRRPDRHRVRGPPARRRGPGHRPRRARGHGARRARAGPPVGLDQGALTAVRGRLQWRLASWSSWR